MTTSTKRQLAARKIAEVFRTEGYDGASMSGISAATGLQKSSLYHHFPNGKEDMAHAALDALGAEAKEQMFAPLFSSATPRQRLKNWAEGMSGFYGQGANNCILAAVTMSSDGKDLTPRVKEAFEAWISALAQVVTDAGFCEAVAQARARAAVEQVQGALIVARALDDTTGFQELIGNLPDQLMKGTPESGDSP